MKKNIVLILSGTLVILLFVTIYLVVSLKKTVKEKEEYIKSNSDSQFYMNVNYKILEDQTIQYNNEATVISENIILEDEKGKKIPLKGIYKNKTILVLRYSELNCQECVNKQVKALKDFAKEVGEDNILLIASYRERRNLYLFKRMNQIHFNVYNIKEDGLGMNLEKLSIPYFFVLDHNNIASLVFIPTKEFESLLKSYLSVIKNRYFKNIKK
jgi:hypothetical protein